MKNKLFVIVTDIVTMLVLMALSGKQTRLDAVKFFVSRYEYATHSVAPVVSCPFTDISDLPQSDQDIICKAYGLKITAGYLGGKRWRVCSGC